MPIDRQVVESDQRETKSRELEHQSPVTEVMRVIDYWTRQQQHLAGVFPGNLLEKCTLLRVGKVMDTFDGRDHLVAFV